MNGRQVGYDADIAVKGVDLQRIGREFNVPALATDRYQSRINAHVAAKGEGTEPKTMSVTASGQMTDSEVLGGRIPELTFDAKIAGDAVQGRASGSFEGFDPAVLSGRAAAKGTVAGRLDVDAEMTNVSAGVTPESVEGTVRMTLAPSTIGDLQITRADVDADYRMRTAEFRKLEVVGRDVNVDATGTLALNETDQSNLTLHADTPSLEEVGKIVGMPLTGIAKVDATITGNRTELQANGTPRGVGRDLPRQRRVVADDDLRRASS